VSKFQEINTLKNKNAIYFGKKYLLPIQIASPEILNDPAFKEHKEAILEYSNAVKKKNTLLPEEQIFIPHSILACSEAVGNTPAVKTVKAPILGKKYEKIEILDESLKGRAFYLVSGHGGPDPGAVYKEPRVVLCEDEYAYDVTLRLYRNLIARGATVHMIIADPDDGIRTDRHLECDRDEKCNGRKIPLNQIARLSQRSEYVNRLYLQNKASGITDHQVVIIHVDSRPARSRQDVFFMHAKGSKKGKKLAKKLHQTFKEKYKIHRKNGRYDGTVAERNLYVLRKTHPPAVYVELANIQNPRDQKRIIKHSNRQALADWLMEGLIR